MLSLNAISFDLYTVVTAVSVILAMAFKDAKWFFYSVLVAAFMFFGWITIDAIKAFDPDKIYRYFIFSFFEALFVVSLYLLWTKEYIRDYHFLLGFTLSSVMVFMYLFRYVDRHFLDFALNSGSFYKAVLPACNGMFALSCIMPVYEKVLKNKFQKI